MSLDLQTLIEKLDPKCRKALESSAELCVSQTNYNVEIEHLFLKLSDIPDSDAHIIFRFYNIKSSDVSKELTRTIEQLFKRGNNRTPALSPQIIQLFEQAWLLTSLYFQSNMIHCGAIMLALLDDDALRGLILTSCPCLKQIPRSSLKKDIIEIFQRQNGKKNQDTVYYSNSSECLEQYTIDLTQRAKKGEIDPICGRDAEIRQIIDILTRRRQNNPILTGDAGVGKTAVVEGFALMICKKQVPPSLQNVSLRVLDLGLLQAGAGIKGEFEKRLKSVIDAVKNATHPVILFIDEAHTLIGAGAPAGAGDAANLLKPALARGELRTIAATTWSEYKKYFEKDPALARRFQVIQVKEPDEAQAITMLRGVVSKFEDFHKVTVTDSALRDAVRFSQKYITGRQLPDKAISVLDTACARVSVAQNTFPAEIQALIHNIELLESELEILKKENKTGINHQDKIDKLETELNVFKEKYKGLEKRWKDESELVRKIISLKKQIEVCKEDVEPFVIEKLRKKLEKQKKELEIVRDNAPAMVCAEVDSQVIASVISGWTGIPVGKMLTDEIELLLNLNHKMSERIIGQNPAIDTICRRIRTYRANLDDPGKPVGVFLLVGPSGVGKTETAITIADILYGGEKNLITLSMSEYQESYTVSGLKGSPPGYVGYGKGGVLTEAVRHNPYSVVLLDEIEKAHPDVTELFYQVFDRGTLEDSEGQLADFKNTVIFLTSNIGSEIILSACKDPQNLPDEADLIELIRPELLKHFKAAFLGRLVIVPYYRLEDKVIQQIVRLKLSKIQKRFAANHNINLTYSEDLVSAIAERCTDTDTGARNIDNVLTHILLPEVSGELLRRMSCSELCTGIHVSFDSDGFSYRFEPSSDSKYSAPVKFLRKLFSRKEPKKQTRKRKSKADTEKLKSILEQLK